MLCSENARRLPQRTFSSRWPPPEPLELLRRLPAVESVTVVRGWGAEVLTRRRRRHAEPARGSASPARERRAHDDFGRAHDRFRLRRVQSQGAGRHAERPRPPPVAHPLHHPLLARGTHGTGQQCCGVGPTPSSHMHRTSPERLKAPAGEPGAREQPCSISTAIEGDAGRTSATYRGVCPRASPKARVARPSCVCPGDPLRHRSAGSVLSDRWSGSVVLST